jgi:hypothetical protein
VVYHYVGGCVFPVYAKLKTVVEPCDWCLVCDT